MKAKNLIRSLLFVCSLIQTQATFADTVELAYFKQKEGVSEKQILSAAKGMEQTLKGWEGFKSRELIHLGDNKWVDVVHWTDKQSAVLAIDKAMQSEVCLTFFALIESREEDMHHGEIRLKQ